MKNLWVPLSAIATLAMVLLASFTMLRGSAAEPPGNAERVVARRLRSMAIPASAAQRMNPIPDSPGVQSQAREHWADHCAGCHANNGSGDIDMGKRMYPPAPDMRTSDTQSLTDGELFYIIENGVRLTGMPAWGGAGRDGSDSWKLVRFIRHLPHLTAAEIDEMKALNPKTPGDLREEQAERLSGRATPGPAPQHYHH